MKCHVEFHRKRRRLTQNELGDKVGLLGSQISRIERGINEPSVSTALKISSALDATVSQLFVLEDQDLAEQKELKLV